MPMPSHSVRSAGNRHSYGGYAGGADASDGAVTCRGCAGQRQGASGSRCRLPPALEAVSPLGRSACARFRAGLRPPQGRRPRAPDIDVRGKLGRGQPQRGRMPGYDRGGMPALGIAPSRGLCAPGTAHSRAPRAAGCQGDVGEGRSRTQLPGSGVPRSGAASAGPPDATEPLNRGGCGQFRFQLRGWQDPGRHSGLLKARCSRMRTTRPGSPSASTFLRTPRRLAHSPSGPNPYGLTITDGLSHRSSAISAQAPSPSRCGWPPG